MPLIVRPQLPETAQTRRDLLRAWYSGETFIVNDLAHPDHGKELRFGEGEAPLILTASNGLSVTLWEPNQAPPADNMSGDAVSA